MDEGGVPAPNEDPDRWYVQPPVIVLAVALVAIAIVYAWASLAGGDDGRSLQPGSSTIPAASPATSADLGEGQVGGAASGDADGSTKVAISTPYVFQPWPTLPPDGPPPISSRPGPGPLFPDAAGVVLYVNSLGRPTIIDLASGRTSEAEVSAQRSFDELGVEDGEFRAFENRLNVPRAGPDAVVVYLHRFAPLGGVTHGDRGPGIDLCLSAACPGVDVTADPGVPGVRLLDGRDAPEATALMSSDGPVEGRFRIVDTVSGPYRLPLPADGPVWLLGP